MSTCPPAQLSAVTPTAIVASPANSLVPLARLWVVVHVEVLGAAVHVAHHVVDGHFIDVVGEIQIIKQVGGPAV